jgi:hypothetical protein
MVDANQIKKVVKQYFKISGQVSIQPDGVVDVQGDVELKRQIKQLPVQFGHVEGHFNCSHNLLTSLQGAPVHVEGSFQCYANKLTSLQGAPVHVEGSFYCYNNKLTSLKGAPDHVEGDFNCGNNLLTSLQGAPRHVGADFICQHNNLTSLQGAPEYVGDEFWCTWNPQLPVLRLITYQDLWIRDAPGSVSDIISKYEGTKNPADILRCASELNEAGFEGNAQW